MAIYRAGMVPYWINPDTNRIEMLFMKPSDPAYGGDDDGVARFQIAKGKIDPGENAEQAAIREAGEELGLKRDNIDGPVYNVGSFLGRTEIFCCKVKNKNNFNAPDFETEETQWMTVDSFLMNGRPLHHNVVIKVVTDIMTNEA